LDWNKAKTIFIIVFSILNIFLYYMYVNRYNEAQSVPVIGDTDFSTRLKDENITIKNKPAATINVSYISGKIKKFNMLELAQLKNQKLHIGNNDTEIVSKITKPMPLTSLSANNITQFVEKNVYKGRSYRLWKIDKLNKVATFFQVSDNRTIYYNQNAAVKVHWNDANEITNYEQRMFDSLKSFGEKGTLIEPEKAIKAILNKGYLMPNSTITKIELGYSTLVPLTQIQVLAPTWYIHVELPKDKKGIKNEVDYFVNADGTIVDIEHNAKERELQQQ